MTTSHIITNQINQINQNESNLTNNQSTLENLNNKIDNKILNILKKQKINDGSKLINLVLSGGGFRGIGITGAFKIFNDSKLFDNLQNIACTSVGALIGGLYCIGYSPDELSKIILKLDIEKIICPNPNNFIQHLSLDDGERFEFVIGKLIEAKKLNKNITLKEVYNIKKINLIITGTCLNDSDIYYFTHLNNPDMPLLTCIRISTSVPFIFKPVVYKNKTYVDGGLMDNYPMHLFKNDINNTIGIYVKDIHKYKDNFENIQTHLFSIFECALEGQTMQTCFFPENTLMIELPYVSMIDKIETKTKKELFFIGCEKAKHFIKNKFDENSNIII